MSPEFNGRKRSGEFFGRNQPVGQVAGGNSIMSPEFNVLSQGAPWTGGGLFWFGFNQQEKTQ